MGSPVSRRLAKSARYNCRFKEPYASASDARVAAAARLRGTGVVLHVYECPACGRWHLTKKPQGVPRG